MEHYVLQKYDAHQKLVLKVTLAKIRTFKNNINAAEIRCFKIVESSEDCITLTLEH